MINKIEGEVLEKYLNTIIEDKFHRYRSWDNCFKSFSNNKLKQNHSLQLGFYLASWGMYRGSCGLLQKSHLIHDGAIELIYKNKYEELRCSETQEVSKRNVLILMDLKRDLVNYYNAFQFVRGFDQFKISATDTLVSKILLGTMACVPAFDRYFIAGMKGKNMKFSKFNETSLNVLFDFAEFNKKQIEDFQTKIYKKIKIHYPTMKILDMYFWQIGYDKEEQLRTQKKETKKS